MKGWATFGLICLAILGLIVGARPVVAGAYIDIVDCGQVVDGFCAQGTDKNGDPIGAFAIMHPPGYDGTQAVVEVDVCTSPSDPELVGPTQGAVLKWHELNPVTGNCSLCILPEDPHSAGTLHAESVILHEVGHALGLGHPNLLFADPEDPNPPVNGLTHTSYSAAYDGVAQGVMIGSDGVRGSKDDLLAALFGTNAVNINWFREVDNDPFVIDGSVIDINSFSRSTNTMLPSGSTWAASANYCLGFQLGHPRTQAVMFSLASTTTMFSGITADDANMVKMQRSGEDRSAGTVDDYVTNLNWVPVCADAEIEIRFEALSPGVAGSTDLSIAPTFPSPLPPLARHYTVGPGPALPAPRVVVLLNQNANWDFRSILFGDGFEAGNFSSWSTVSADGEVSGATLQGIHPYFCPVLPPPAE